MLEPRTVLQRSADLDIHVDASNRIFITVAGRVVPCGTYGLGVLDAFTWPTSVRDASERFRARTPEHWMELTTTMRRLHAAGILVDVAQRAEPGSRPVKGFGAPFAHVSMLNDRTRTTCFLDGIREVVRPGDVVVDIGTGTGILAVAAARAGAARVYAIEATAIADVAAQVFAGSGVAERITLVRGWSTEVDLPERADVLVSETIGNDPLRERLLELTRDARQRLLTPDARILPGRITVLGLPVTIPSAVVNARVPTPEVLTQWRDWYDLDLGALVGFSSRSSFYTLQTRSVDAVDWPVLGAPVVLAEVDVATVDSGFLPERRIDSQVHAAGLLNGMLMYFEAQVGSAVLSTRPGVATAENSWLNPVWVFPSPVRVKSGDGFAVRYQFDGAGGLSQLGLIAD